MIICLCGKYPDTTLVLEDLKETYKDNLVELDYFALDFKTRVKNEKVKYQIEKDVFAKCKFDKDPTKYPEEVGSKISQYSLEAIKKYNEYVNEIVLTEVNELINSSKDTIVVFTSSNELLGRLDKTQLFDKADFKILVNSDNFDYDEDKFDFVISKNEKLDTKKLVKL